MLLGAHLSSRCHLSLRSSPTKQEVFRIHGHAVAYTHEVVLEKPQRADPRLLSVCKQPKARDSTH